MGNRIKSIQYEVQEDGIEVRGWSQSDRGSKFLKDRIMVKSEGKSKEEFQQALEAAVRAIFDKKE